MCECCIKLNYGLGTLVDQLFVLADSTGLKLLAPFVVYVRRAALFVVGGLAGVGRRKHRLVYGRKHCVQKKNLTCSRLPSFLARKKGVWPPPAS